MGIAPIAFFHRLLVLGSDAFFVSPRSWNVSSLVAIFAVAFRTGMAELMAPSLPLRGVVPGCHVGIVYDVVSLRRPIPTV